MRTHRARLGVALAISAILGTGSALAAGSGAETVIESTRWTEAYWNTADGAAAGSEFGNVHIGALRVDEIGNGVGKLTGRISDYDCEEGEVIYSGTGGATCDELLPRYLEGNVAFGFDAPLDGATADGTVTVFRPIGSYEEWPIIGTVAVDLDWVAEGDIFPAGFKYRNVEQGSIFLQSWSAKSRLAVADGSVGAMPVTSYFGEVATGRSRLVARPG